MDEERLFIALEDDTCPAVSTGEVKGVFEVGVMGAGSPVRAQQDVNPDATRDCRIQDDCCAVVATRERWHLKLPIGRLCGTRFGRRGPICRERGLF